MTNSGPPGWQRHQVLHRRDSTAGAPLTFDKATRSVDAVLSVGSPVQRIFGTEVLRVTPAAVDTTRITSSLCPLLDSHNNTTISNVLGRVSQTWFVGGALHGRLIFAETPQGKLAMGMVQRGEITGVSLGYRVDEWEVRDQDDDVIDPDKQRISWDDNLTFTATKWQILECSLVSTPADTQALIRSITSNPEINLIRERMQIRQAMHDRQQAILQ
jgi:phage head maturation protease